MEREYNHKLGPEIEEIEGEIYENYELLTVEEWEEVVNVIYRIDDGNGYWVKDGYESKDEVFSTPKLDATHVAYYSK